MSNDADSATPETFTTLLAQLGAATLRALHGVELGQRRLDPAQIDGLRRALAEPRQELSSALAALEACQPPVELAGLREALLHGARHAERSLLSISEEAPPGEEVARVLAGFRSHCRAQEALYPLRAVFPPLGRFFVEPAWHERLASLDPEPTEVARVGIHRAPGTDGRSKAHPAPASRADGDGEIDSRGDRGRGGFSLYVPEQWDGRRSLPLVVALHGGFGHGADFLWTWLREARGRGFLVLAPTSRGTTWSFDAPELDGRPLRSMVEYVCKGWNADRRQILLTGLSDGATFALLTGLHPESPFTALAPVSGVLHPVNFASGNMERAHGRRVHIVHGARDWMFPVTLAHMARDALQEAGADVTYCEIPDLSHTYPREENDHILQWFSPELALPS